jgi:hypothetical protein
MERDAVKAGARWGEMGQDGAGWNVRTAISITHMQSVAISCNHLFIERMSGHCIG